MLPAPLVPDGRIHTPTVIGGIVKVPRMMPVANMIESLHMQLRKIIKIRGHFPSDDAAITLIWLTLRNINDGKVRSARECSRMAIDQRFHR